MAEEKHKYCPLSFAKPDLFAEPCMRADCNWYDEEEEACSLVSLARALKTLSFEP